MCTEAFCLTRFDNLIKSEFDLVSHRMSWLMTSQAFLFSAFAISNVISGQRIKELTTILLTIIPLLGITTSLLVKKSIKAAHGVVNDLK
jgi:hypothetical protein